MAPRIRGTHLRAHGARALVYGEIMGDAHRAGSRLSAPDGMIASIAIVNEGRLATRNVGDFVAVPVELVNPWDG